ncbi:MULTISPECIES: branched-chain amino acid ABC transporter permease [Deinococcus]|jgi:branched-chain amino acid transport system permease protein|uniref:Branched-chain amino acid ABC transporter permease n=2 Tax=Deinococcus TaxID=1298 RepID=A0A221SWJ8_9DEIO|nr:MULTISPECIES: branched-chain amino acid ABC transporter permease [Deinococcus]ASN80976.1 branched-chain amino acid ABC transporter permease [Deinococcus ficus]MDP9763004.1 branched-chain amino acid transport system permease protein [Deinococcus enclensis]GHF81730.1 branched-chain amino acid ABC transporter permease [Deinococcus ficus]
MPASRFTQTGNYRVRYQQDQTIFATYAEQASLILGLGLLLLLPLILPKTMLRDVNMILIYAIAVIGLNITTGYTGLINIGQAAFMGVGAYATALAATKLNLPFFLAIPIGGLAGALVGTIVGLPSLRLKYLYLAVATLAFQVIFEWGVGHSPLLEQGGSISMPKPVVFGIEDSFLNHNIFWYYIILPVLVLLALLWRNVLRTKHGRSMIAVRDNDRAAAAMGINPGTAKLTAFMLGSLYAGIAGGLFAYFQKAVVIEDYMLHTSVQLLAMAIVGGLGSLPGAFLGPMFIVTLDRLMGTASESLGSASIFPEGVDVASAMKPLTFGLAIVLFLMFEPRGLANWWRLTRMYFKKWPYKF